MNMMHILVLVFRTVFFYILTLIAVRIMGKRQVGQLQPFELVVTIMIAELAVLPMENHETPLVHGVVPIISIVLLQMGLAYVTLKSEPVQSFICGTPSVVIENGKLVEKELRKLRFSINDLMEQLRIQNIRNISDVEFAIFETTGNLSVIPKSQCRPVTPEDLGIPTEYEGLPMPLIIDGKVEYANLKSVNLNQKWLRKELTKFGVGDPKDVLLATLDTTGELYCQVKESSEPSGKK
jgi:uncharacterized membrane protein YcaP (DUF421 family)